MRSRRLLGCRLLRTLIARSIRLLVPEHLDFPGHHLTHFAARFVLVGQLAYSLSRGIIILVEYSRDIFSSVGLPSAGIERSDLSSSETPANIPGYLPNRRQRGGLS
jgi:hypothetical protein